MAFEVVVPQMGESVLEGTILEWKVKVGDRVELNQPLVELMTDKVNVEIPAEVGGTLIKQLVAEGEVVAVGKTVAIIDDGTGDAVSKSEPEKPASAPSAAASAPSTPTAVAQAVSAPAATATIGKGKMSPKVKMMIRQYSLDPSTIVPTGKEGRVTVEDVQRALDSRTGAAGFVEAGASAAATTPKVKIKVPKFDPAASGERETRVPLQGVRKLISDHMLHSVRTSPHVTTFEDIDLTELATYRNSIKADFKATYGANITFMPFIVKAICLAMKEFPMMNASMTDTEIIYKNYYNIGIAVARDEGLIVPVIKDADRKSIVELAVEIAGLGEKARSNRLTPDDVSGGTFSLTNAGMFGATSSTPIINQPQVAILGIHAIVPKPWVVDDQIVIRNISSFGLSFDHRLIDGHEAVQFLHRVHEYLSDLHKMVLQLR